MKQAEETIVFVGGSIISMLMALYYKKKEAYPGKIVILEKNTELGGLYRSLKYEDDIVFDYGVHIYTEINKPEIDKFFIDILGEDEWEYHEGLNRDISGTAYDGKIQLNTPFVDLRDLPEEKKQQYVDELRAQSHNDINPNSYSNVKEFLTAKFGKSLYEEIFKPIVVKHYKQDPELLDPMATHVIPIGRVVLHDEDVVEKLMGDESLRTRIAFPDQFSLPACYLRQGRLIYPKKFGMYRVVDALTEQLKEYGVEIYLDASVTNIELEGKSCKKVSVSHSSGDFELTNIKELFWNGGYPILAKALGLNQFGSKPEFIKAAFVNILLDKPANVDKMFYLYNFKPDTHIFRIVNYYNYCKSAVTDKGYPLCATTWLHDYDGDVEELVLKELKEIGVITDHKVNFIRTEMAERGFPNLSTEFIGALDKYRADFREQEFTNIKVIGMLAEKGHFYLTEALDAAFSLIQLYCNSEL